MIRFEDLLEKVRGYAPEADVELLRRAYVFSAFEHRGQVRRSGEPYLIHPLAVAEFLVELKLDAVAFLRVIDPTAAARALRGGGGGIAGGAVRESCLAVDRLLSPVTG